ncbi:MAG: glutathione peroxidase [Sandaracinaceae bacterium]|nr:glutathione peroxidase [Sandaracinaceae bacterium]
MSEIYDIDVETLDGRKRTLGDHRGKVMLIVNVASKCGFTPQYEGLEALHRELSEKGLAVLGFPCNQFGKQEPGTAQEIRSFCDTKYGVSFPMYAKLEVNGRDAHVLYRYLTAAKKSDLGDTEVRWNFEKFLVNREGKVVGRYDSRTTPGDLKAKIEALL